MYKSLPLSKEKISLLKDGQIVYLSGKMITARDAAHKKLREDIAGGNCPLNLKEKTIYYAGGCRNENGFISLGPTTSKRMDAYTDEMLTAGVAAFVGKGKRSLASMESIAASKAVYFSAVGGAGAFYAKCIKSSKLIAYPELGCEAFYELEVENFPAIVCLK